MERERRGAGVDEPRADLEARARAVASPRRIFTLTGTSTASATASTIAQARSGSSSSVAPAPVFVTLRTGQPKLMSTRSAPAASTMRAASAISARLRAEDLDRERMLVGGDAQVAERPLVPVLDPGAADHLRADEPGAEAASLAAKRLHADACHRRQDEARRDLDVADVPAFAQIDVMVCGWYPRGIDVASDRRRYHSAPASARLRRAFVLRRRHVEGSHSHA